MKSLVFSATAEGHLEHLMQSRLLSCNLLEWKFHSLNILNYEKPRSSDLCSERYVLQENLFENDGNIFEFI